MTGAGWARVSRFRRWVAGMGASPHHRLVALLVAINLCALAIVAFTLNASLTEHRDRAVVVSRNLSRLVANGIESEINKIDLQLQTVVDEVNRRQAARQPIVGAPMDAFLRRLRDRVPMAFGIRVADASGRVIANSVTTDSWPSFQIDDRDYFRTLAQDPAAGLVVSRPILGRVSNQWMLVFARRLSTPDGRFAGTVHASVPLSWFAARLETIDVGPNGAVVLRADATNQFGLLARFPPAGHVGQTVVSDTFRRMMARDPQGGTYEAAAGADGVHRTFSYQQVGSYPLVVLVGVATQDYLADWWRGAVKMLAFDVIFILVSVSGGLWMSRAWRALEQRTADLARSNADLEQFAYVASHDLQTPLRNIASYAQLLSRRYHGRIDRDADTFIGFIVDGAKQMARMITDILDYARVSTVSCDLVPVEVGPLVERVLARFEDGIASSGADIRVGTMPTVMGEPAQVGSLFQNLIENALKYREAERPPRVEISAVPDGDGWWRFTIADNGIGIDPAYHDKIFVIFQRLDPLRFPEGTGIGLALCRRIVQRLGGTIDLRSAPGMGTEVTFTLRDAQPTPEARAA